MLQESPQCLAEVTAMREPRLPSLFHWHRCPRYRGVLGYQITRSLHGPELLRARRSPSLISGAIFLCYVTEVTWLMCDKLPA